ncbi:hypothetical protein L1987_12962 [Smallanthus sonchifolius]|uniref:Uncharacterized protein n=1 Tax=Smallanthus sonchifolius TaxID=185202 RepID=A0ACB9JHK3_9ASTR|nr:hypothetical protein L1987_12962 [Smallanthus sonchifolius]
MLTERFPAELRRAPKRVQVLSSCESATPEVRFRGEEQAVATLTGSGTLFRRWPLLDSPCFPVGDRWSSGDLLSSKSDPLYSR